MGRWVGWFEEGDGRIGGGELDGNVAEEIKKNVEIGDTNGGHDSLSI